LGATALGVAAALVRRATRLPRPRRGARVAHMRQTEREYRTARTRVLILGAGFGGVTTALELDRRLTQGVPDGGRAGDVSILVIDRDNAQIFSPLLWLVADGRTSPNNVVVPVRAFQRGRDFHLLQAEVERIDLERREVVTSAGSRPYDVLVIALGSITAVPDLPGLRAHARVFHTATDALELRNHLIDAIETAHRLDDPTERQAWLTFVVGGGGDTGIELAATIHNYLVAGLFKEYPWLADAPPRIVIVGRAERLVPMSTARTSAAVERILEAEGIEVLTGAAITAVGEGMVHTSRGDIPAHTLFWAAGVAAPPVVRELPVEHARNGSVLVDERLRVRGRPEVYVIGDSAWAVDPVTRAGVPPTAQAAEHQGRYVAGAIAAGLAGREALPFRFRPRGHLALLGHGTGVAQVGPVTFTGLPAWLLWHGYYLTHIPSWRNRARLAADLLLAWLTGRETGQLRIEPPAGGPTGEGDGAAGRAQRGTEFAPATIGSRADANNGKEQAMTGTGGTAGRPSAGTGGQDAESGGTVPRPSGAGNDLPLSPEAAAQLEAATERVLEEDQQAEMVRLTSEEVGISTDPASDEPSRRFAGE
ncbi:MAG: NAD(P)/FAD-dependent oxidoreductase, partial [Chloroflexota bacterium]|nr:NAD(P)/FAD-dependent oxidoreductase [Chloroflexota bacterium]